jgi:formate dehydrogenase subunit gamma
MATEASQQNPRANFWRSVRKGDEGYTAQTGTDSAVFINSSGHTWQQYRSSILAPLGAWLMAAVLLAILAYFILRGPIRYETGPDSRMLYRFTQMQRISHWFTAILFWLLALSGLILLYGRYVLIPLFGQKGFAITASACKEAHNLFGPMFLLALTMLFVFFVRDNVYEKGDLGWLARGGGLFGGHVSAGRFNMGEKIWFWLVVLLGLVVSVSGLVLDFAVAGQGRDIMGMSHVLHTAGAIVFIAVSFGHIYLGTVGTKGTLRGMTSGYVDSGWAQLHHDRWSGEEVPEGEARVGVPAADTGAAS